MRRTRYESVTRFLSGTRVSLKHVRGDIDVAGWYAKTPWGWVFLARNRYAARKIAAMGFDPSMPSNDPRQPFGEPYCGVECL